jgi:hypothetical protein
MSGTALAAGNERHLSEQFPAASAVPLREVGLMVELKFFRIHQRPNDIFITAANI